jgi:hypothetical protein
MSKLSPNAPYPKLAPLVREIGRPAATSQKCNRWLHKSIEEYALHDARKPIGVATYRTVKKLPGNLKGQLPSPEQIIKLLEDVA